MRKNWLLFAVFGLAMVGCPRPDPEAGFCTDNIDNDEDGLTDCDDVVDCSNEATCKAEICNDGVDNNANGQIDCADTACAANSACVESNCGDNIDNDNDTQIDCADSDCDANPACTPTNCGNNTVDAGEQCDDGNTVSGDGCSSTCQNEVVAVCGNGTVEGTEQCDGNNLDGQDCTTIGGFTGGNLTCDGSCNLVITGCTGGNGAEVCVGGVDEDSDGFIDCDDFDCTGNAACGAVAENNDTTCSDGQDNDQDSFADCADFDCNVATNCIALEICNDGLDNDGDTRTDCADGSCTNNPLCAGTPENTDALCIDGISNDNDNFVDCADRDCDVATNCIALEICNDGLDNDGDFAFDCADGSCANNALCNAGSVSIQDIQDGTVTDGSGLTTDNVFVTAIKGGAGQNVTFYIQEPQGLTDNGHTYPEFAGVAVFVASAQSAGVTLPAIGDCVTISGKLDAEFNATGLTEIIGAQAGTAPGITINAQANCTALGAFPTAFAIPSNGVTFADVSQGPSAGTAGPKTENFEGVLVKLNNIQATTIFDGFTEFSVAEQSNVAGPVVNIDDFMFKVTPDPTVGQNFTSITGIFSQFVNFKVQPRNAADVQ